MNIFLDISDGTEESILMEKYGVSDISLELFSTEGAEE
jgi:hypothetical protein